MTANGKPIFEKKKKSLLSLLLLLLGSKRNIFVALMVVVLLASATLAVPAAMLLQIPGMAAVLSLLGVDVAALGAGGHGKSAKSLMAMMMDRTSVSQQADARYGKGGINGNGSYNSNGSQSGSSIDMVTGGRDLMALHDAANAKGGKGGNPGGVNGVVSDEDSKDGDGAQGVPGQDLLEGSLKWQGGSGGSVGGINGSMDSSGMNSKPYVGGSMDGSGGASSTDMHSYTANAAANSTNGRVPVVNGQGYSSARAGQYSSFAWKKLATEGAGKNYGLKSNGKKTAMSRLSETFTTTAMAYDKGISNESRSSFTGATYDGNSVNANVLTASVSDGGGSTSVPSPNTTTTLLEGATGLQTAADTCVDAQSSVGTQLSADELAWADDIRNLGSNKPSCCSSSRNAWNKKVDTIYSLCNKINTEGQQMATACQSTHENADCQYYESNYHVNSCSWWKCFFDWLVAIVCIVLGAILLIFSGGLLAAVAGVLLIAAGALLLAGLALGSAGTGFLGAIAAVGAFFSGGTAAATSAGTAATISSDDSTTGSR